MKKILTLLILLSLLTGCTASKDSTNRDNLEGTTVPDVEQTNLTLPVTNN